MALFWNVTGYQWNGANFLIGMEALAGMDLLSDSEWSLPFYDFANQPITHLLAKLSAIWGGTAIDIMGCHFEWFMLASTLDLAIFATNKT